MSYSPGALIAVPQFVEILIGIDHHYYVWITLYFSNGNVIITRFKC